MLKKLFQSFANTISEMWYGFEDEDELGLRVLSKILAICFVVITIVCICALVGILMFCLKHPIVFVSIGLPIFIIYFITKKIAEYGKDSKLNKEKQFAGGLQF